MYEWMHEQIPDPKLRYKAIDDGHPSDYAHEKFVNDVILKWGVV